MVAFLDPLVLAEAALSLWLIYIESFDRFGRSLLTVKAPLWLLSRLLTWQVPSPIFVNVQNIPFVTGLEYLIAYSHIS